MNKNIKNKMLINLDVGFKKNKLKIFFEFDENTKIMDLLLYLFDYIDNDSKFLYDVQDDLIGHFSFVDNFGKEQKAQLEFSVQKFLNNFNYDINCVNMKYFCAFGIGGYYEFEDIAKIQINSSEPRHKNPHVHITRIGKHDNYFRIDLNTLTQMNGDKFNWNKEFNRKERELIIDFLIKNKEKLIDFYNRYTKGEYITEEYVLNYDGQKYFFSGNRTY